MTRVASRQDVTTSVVEVEELGARSIAAKYCNPRHVLDPLRRSGSSLLATEEEVFVSSSGKEIVSVSLL